MSTKQKRKTFDVRLTKFELIHLRDLFSIMLPPDAKVTVSQSLAATTNRSIVEAVLWKKLSNLCRESGVPLDDDAPDYIIAPASPPPLNVFELSHDPSQSALSSSDEDEDEENEEEEDDDEDD